jgi:hypothetical protein
LKEDVPTTSSVIEHEPTATPLEPDTVAWQVLVPSETVTDPVGVVAPEADDGPVTETLMVTAWPTVGLEGEVELMAVNGLGHPPGPPKLMELEDVLIPV